MTLREIGHFLLGFGEEFGATFLWKTEWLDSNVVVVLLVCVSYLIISLISGGLMVLFIDATRSQFRKSGGLKGLLGLLIEQFFSFWLGWVLMIMLGWLWSSFTAKWVGLVFAPSLLLIFWGFILKDWGTRTLERFKQKSQFINKL